MKKRTMMITIMGLAMLILAACNPEKSSNSSKDSQKDTWSEIEKKKEIVIGLDDTFVPMGFRDESDNIVGFDVDLAKAVFAEYGIKPKFQPIDWGMKESELNNGSIDLIWNGYTVNAERKEKVAFSDSYMSNKQILVTLKSSDIKSVDDMKGKTLGAQNASSGLSLVENNPEVLLDKIDDEPVLFDTFNEALIDLKAKRIDGIIIDRGYAGYYISKQDNPDDFMIVDTPFKDEDFAVGIRKGDTTLQKKINEVLEKLKNEGKIKEIDKKWFGKD